MPVVGGRSSRRLEAGVAEESATVVRGMKARFWRGAIPSSSMNTPTVRAWCGDTAYCGTFEKHVRERHGLPIHISERIHDGFVVLPRRWVVERTFAWANGQRRLSKDYEKDTLHSEAMIHISAVAPNLRALAA